VGLFYSEKWDYSFGLRRGLRAESGPVLSPQGFSLDCFCGLYAGAFLRLPSLRTDMASDYCCAIRKTDRFPLPLIRRRFQVEHVESRASDVSFLQQSEESLSFNNVSSRSIDQIRSLAHHPQP